MEKNYLNKKGITLIALIVTIILLLILAGVAIVSISGSDGLIAKSKYSVQKSRATQLIEEIKLAITENELSKQTDNNVITKADLVAKLTEIGKLTKEEKE